MNTLERRGRVIFLILATLITLERLSTVGLALMGDWSKLHFWQSVFWPLVTVDCIICLWQGDNLMRWVLAVWFLVRGGSILLVLGKLLFALSSATPPDKMRAFLDIMTPLVGFPIIYGLGYVGAGLTLLLSKSLVAFFRYQVQQEVMNPFLALARRIGLYRRNAASESVNRFLREYENRTRYPVLNRQILEPLADNELESAVVDYVSIKLSADYSRTFQIFQAMPLGIQAVYSTWWVRAECENGGIHQYFYNKGVDWAFVAIEGYKRLGSPELAALMAQAIDLYLKEEPEQLALRPEKLSEMIDRYVEARGASSLPELDTHFYKHFNDKLAAKYIRSHLDEFVAD